MSESKPTLNPEEIKGYECKHALYRAWRPEKGDYSQKASDVVLVKENIHFKDGRIVPNVRLLHNYQREFWMTKPGFQNHNDKKEWELESRCIKKTCSQIELPKKVAQAMGYQSTFLPLRRLARSQYLYGCDVTPPVLVKHHYKTKWADCISKASVALLDLETDVVWGTEEILSGSLTFRDRAFLVVTEKFLGTIINPEDRIHKRFKELMKGITVKVATSAPDLELCNQQLTAGTGTWRNETTVVFQGVIHPVVCTVVQGKIESSYTEYHVDKRVGNLEVCIVKTPGELCKVLLDRAHAWRPDFVSIWNIAYDIPKILQALEKEGYDVGDVFSDPCVPEKYRKASFNMDQAIKVTQSGKSNPKHPADLWHTMDCLASFYFIDQMALYKKIRAAKGNEPNYKLDYILNKNLKIGKLVIPEVPDTDHGLQWHVEMQRNWKIEYLIYNLFDCISVELLDEKTNDAAMALGQITNVSEFKRFPSIPRRTVDNLHFFCRDRGLVIGTTSDEMTDDNDDYIVGIQDWILTLPSHLVSDAGMRLFDELPDQRSSMYAHVYDLDCVSTYPTTEEVLNISRETTFRELSRMENLDESVQRTAGLNLTGGKINALEICMSTMNFPHPDVLLQAFLVEQANNTTLQ